jgi:hypothetical protein
MNGRIFTIGRSEALGWCAVKSGDIIMPYSIIFLRPDKGEMDSSILAEKSSLAANYYSEVQHPTRAQR